MINHSTNVSPGDHVIDTWADESLLVTDVRYRTGRGWECWTQRPDGSMGPTFYPHPDGMPDPDPWLYGGE